MQNHLKMKYLESHIRDKKLNRFDRRFIYRFLIPDNRHILSERLKEKVILKDEKIKRVTGNLKQLYTIFNNPGFTAEFSAQLCRMYPKYRICVMDTDRLMPALDVYLNAKTYVKSIYSHLQASQSTGINLLIDGYHKNCLTKKYVDHIAIKISGFKHLYYFAGSYRIDDYEYYKLDAFQGVVEVLKQHFDVVILSCNGFIYDAFTCHALMVSDLNLIPIRGNMPEIRSARRQMTFLEVKQDIDVRKNQYILFDRHDQHIHPKVFSELVQGYYLGNIPYDMNRDRSMQDHYRPIHHQSRNAKWHWNHVLSKIQEKTNELGQ